jgi:hypothetical protein
VRPSRNRMLIVKKYPEMTILNKPELGISRIMNLS